MSVQEECLNLHKEVWIYTGPSLSVEEAKELAPFAQVFPPAARGDIMLALEVEQLPKIIVLIDGAFVNTLTASPREILSLMNQGIKVIGSSSLGAIRAAELHTYGMIGVGRVFEMYRDEVVIADDEVAMAMDPATGMALSEPLIHFRVLLEMAVQAGIMEAVQSNTLFVEMEELYFPHRTVQTFFKKAESLLDAEQFGRLKALAVEGQHRVKSLDAIQAIETAGQLLTL